MLIALASGKGSPGTTVTALALALSWPRPVLLAELDPRGGDICWGYAQGRDTAGRGLLALQVESRNQPMVGALWSQVVELKPGASWWLPGLEEPRHAGTVEWATLARTLSFIQDIDVIADCGSISTSNPQSMIWTSADLVALVVGSSLSSTHSAQSAAGIIRPELTSGGLGVDRLVSVCVGPGRPYPVGEVKSVLSASAPMIGAIKWDPTTAVVLSQGVPASRKFERSGLLADAAKLAVALGSAAMDHRRSSFDRSSMAAPTRRAPAWAPGATAPGVPTLNGGGMNEQ